MSFDTQLTNRVTTNLQPYLWTGLDIAFVSSLSISHVYACTVYSTKPYLHSFTPDNSQVICSNGNINRNRSFASLA
jgi:hypothetical protein